MAAILLVNDEKIVRTLVSVALKRQGHSVIEASSGRQALAAAERTGARIDLLVTELSLPKMSGLDLSQKLAAIQPEAKFLFVSRSPHPRLLEERARQNDHTVLREPFDVMTLLGEVTRLLPSSSELRKPASRADEHRPRSKAKANGHTSP